MLALSADFHGAAQEHRSALAEHEWVAPGQPLFPDRERLLGVAQENLCEALTRSGAADEAIPHCQAAVTFYRSQLAADRRNLQAIEDLASGLTNLSRALDRARRPREALEVDEGARGLCAQALVQDPDSLDLASANADSLLELASLDRQLGADALARAAFQEGKTALAALTLRFPQTHMFRDLQTEAARLEMLLH
jgi:hypothetical protein